jgi:hypothetical protein
MNQILYDELSGGKFDLQSSLNGPGFSWAKYPGEYHLTCNYNYLGPKTRTDIRLDENLQPKPGELPYNQVDTAAYHHDVKYILAEETPDPLDSKHIADHEMLEELDRIKTSGTESFVNFITKLALKAKLKLGIGIQNDSKLLSQELEQTSFVRSRLADELHRPIIHNFQRRHVIITNVDDTWSADLIIMPTSDNNYKNILSVIDNFSKYAWCIPLKSKRTDELISSFKSIFNTSHRKPKKIWSDHESGLYSNEFQNFCIENDIILYSTQSELKAMIVERFNRTFKEKLWRKFTELNDSNHWVNLISLILSDYNNTIHSTIKMTPIEASKPENSYLVKNILRKKYQKYNSKPPKYSTNDMVRIYQWKPNLSKKGYTPNYTREVFKIKEVHDTVPWTYTLIDKNNEIIQGKFYQQELTKSVFDFDNK